MVVITAIQDLDIQLYSIRLRVCKETVLKISNYRLEENVLLCCIITLAK